MLLPRLFYDTTSHHTMCTVVQARPALLGQSFDCTIQRPSFVGSGIQPFCRVALGFSGSALDGQAMRTSFGLRKKSMMQLT